MKVQTNGQPFERMMEDTAQQRIVVRDDAKWLRALFVLNSLNMGGSETKIVRLVNALYQRGVQTGIAYLCEPGALRALVDPDLPVWHLERRGKFSFAALSRLLRVISTTHPRVVFSVNLYPTLYVALAAMYLGRQSRTVGLLNTSSPPPQERWRMKFYRPFLRRLDGIVFGCERQRQEWAPYVHRNAKRSCVIYNGVDTTWFAPMSDAQSAHLRDRQGISGDAFVFGTVGRLAPEKNQVALIEALSTLRKENIDAHVIIVGTGSERARLEQRARTMRVQSHVSFVGMQGDVRPWLAMMDVFVLPSKHVETFSNAALEAMAMRRPVILSRIGGADEMVRDGVDGHVIELDELDVALPQLLRTLHADPIRRQRLGRNARERVEREFSIDSMVKRFARLIEGSDVERRVS